MVWRAVSEISDLRHIFMRKSGRSDFLCHRRLFRREVVRTWSPRHKAGHETKGKRIVTTNGASLAAPLGLLAELTHRCPLGCPYCSNPLALDKRDDELDTATWGRVFREAAALGVLQVHLSGGEPAARRDLPELVKAAREAGLYNNLITSAVGLNSAESCCAC